ncbi:cupin domain-containing protein [Marisediminicola senii]|uniref:cupin domain-containing protein n=1 Tax=Marisediminicola senii TaxID=2711233 RepID=UPI0013EC7220|nr:cupin domain-containing protein [Marisediminicola senii]
MIGIDADEFARQHWGTAPLLTRAADDFSDLLTLAAVDEIVANRAIRTPFVRMATEGSVLAAGRYTASGGFGAEIGDQLSSEKVLAEFAAGATLVLQGLHRTWAPLADFTRQLVADVGHPSQVNAYVTPASSRGFDPHYDVHDVFVLQVHGEKHWTIHEPVHPDPLRDQPWTDHRADVAARAAGAPAIDATLQPGDVLYLPRGWLHSASALGGTSIHLTIGVAAYTRADVLRQLLAVADRDPALRGSLPLGIDLADPDALRDIVAKTVSDFTASVQREDAASTVASGLSRRLVGATRPEPVRPLATVDAIATLDGSTSIGWRGGLSATITTTDATVSIVLPSKTVTLPAECAPAVTALERGGVTGADALHGLDPASSLVVARRLLREGIAVIR